jgi:hypothetical protein
MSLNTSVLDLSGVIAMLAAIGGVTGVLAVLRILFLDRLLSGFNAAQQNILLRAILILLNYAAVVGLALLLGATPGRSLFFSAALATLGASAGSHLVFTGIKTVVSGGPSDAGQFPQGVNAFPDLGLPTTPADVPPAA